MQVLLRRMPRRVGDLPQWPQDPAADGPAEPAGQDRRHAEPGQRVDEERLAVADVLGLGGEAAGHLLGAAAFSGEVGSLLLCRTDLVRALAEVVELQRFQGRGVPHRVRPAEMTDEPVGGRNQYPAHDQEQPGTGQRDPGPDAPDSAPHGTRYPPPMTVSMSGGSPSLRRNRITVTATALVNGSANSSQTCSSSCSALITPPSATSSTSRTPSSL